MGFLVVRVPFWVPRIRIIVYGVYIEVPHLGKPPYLVEIPEVHNFEQLKGLSLTVA